MNNRKIYERLLILVSLVFPLLLSSQTTKGTAVLTNQKTQKNTYALIIGISKYEKLPPLSFAHNDAYAFRDYLLLSQKLPANNVFCLVNDSASSLNIFDKLYTINDSLKEGDRFIFYFSGHGDWESKVSDNSLLLLSKAPTHNYLRYPDQFISCQTLNDFLRKIAERNIKTILIADACRSGNLVGGQSGAEQTNLQLTQSWKNDVRILSSMPDELSYEDRKWGGGRGVFSYYLTLGLMGAGKKDTAKAIDITLNDLRSYIEENVNQETGGKQNPLVHGDARTVLFNVERKKMFPLETEKGKPYENSLAVARGTLDTSSMDFKILAQKFNDYITANRLTAPFTDCALSILGSMQKLAPASYLNSYKTSFLTSVANNFRNYADKFYEEIGYPVDELIDLKAQVQASMILCNNQPILYNTYYSKRLFLEACIATHSAQSSFDRRVDGEHLNTAKDSLEKALELTPFEPLLYKKLGECYSALKSPKAIDILQKYIRLLPNDAASYNSLGIAFYKNKEYQKAVEQLSVAIKLSPQNARYLYNLAMGYQALGQDQQAKFYFKKSQSVQPADGTQY